MKELLKDEVAKPATDQIEGLRKEFQELLEKLNVKLVVLVDDLDRCLPETAVSTLEAMRLLLFVDRTAFIIAADEQMIRNGVRAHFGDVELSEGLITSYFDKLIQVPITVPRLGIAEIKVYIVLLYIEADIRKNNLDEKILTDSQKKLNDLLSGAWQAPVTKETIEKALQDITLDGLSGYISLADQLAGILATADNIKGNPRLIKRFMNSLEIRKKVATFNGITVDPGLLIKMLLFERCASAGAFHYLTQQVLQDEDGKPSFIKELEDSLVTGNEYKAPDTNWETDFIKKWLLLSPALGEMDLRPLIYLSKDRSMPFAAYDELTPEGKRILEALKVVKNGPAIQDLISEFMDQNPDADFGNLSDDQIWSLTAIYLGNEVFNRIQMDIGQAFEKQDVPYVDRVTRLNDMREYIQSEIAIQMDALRKTADQNVDMNQLFQDTIKNTFEVFEVEV